MSDERPRIVYALLDVREPGRLRYVGQAVHFSQRMAAHRNPGPNSRGPAVRWLAEIGAEHMRSIKLETVAGPAAADAAEQEWIARLRGQGHDLLNILDGGRRGYRGTEGFSAALRAAARPGKRVGVDHHAHLLDDEKVRLIRQRLRERQRIVDIAREVGVARQTINAIRDGRTWRHVS